MSDFGPLVGWGVVVAASVAAGAVAAAVLRLPPRGAALVSSFAGGVLLAAVAFELVPDADERAGLWMTAVGLLAGTLTYVGADTWLSRNEEMKAMRRSVHAAAAGRQLERSLGTGELARGETIAAGLVVDGVPESIALGLTVAEGEVGRASRRDPRREHRRGVRRGSADHCRRPVEALHAGAPRRDRRNSRRSHRPRRRLVIPPPVPC